MNHIYRIVFNRAMGVYQVASENASAHRSGSKRLALSITGALVLAALAGAPADSHAQSTTNITGSVGGTGGQSSSGGNSGGLGGLPGQVGDDGQGDSSLAIAGGGGGGGSGAAGGAGGTGAGSGQPAAAGGAAGSGGTANGGAVTGNSGGSGQAAVGSANGGGGGGGGASAFQYSGTSTAILTGGTWTGGNGGVGGQSFTSGNGIESGAGGGGAGGYGVHATAGSVTITDAVQITGGKGGTGGQGGGFGGNGGDGGNGVQFESTGTLTNNGVISGGQGGVGGSGQNADISIQPGGLGGRGGAGVSLGDGATFINSRDDDAGTIGTVTGGDFGFPGANSSGSPVYGGVGVLAGSNTVIINNGNISGGQGSGLGQQGNAVEINGDNSRLVLQDNSSLQGNIVARGNNNTLEYNLVNNSASLLVSDILTAEPTLYFMGQVKVFGFSSYEKTGASTLTLTGATAAVTPWNVKAGVLSVDDDSNLGATSGGLTLDGGTLRITHDVTFDSARTITLGAAGGTFDNEMNRAGTIAGLITGTGSLTKISNGVLELDADNTYTGTTYVTGGTLRLGNNGATGNLTGGLDVTYGALADFTRAGDYTYGGAISGAGQVNMSGSGTLILTGASTQTGILQIGSGTVQVGNGGTIGSIASAVDLAGGSLVFNRADDSTFTGIIYEDTPGVGSVEKRGTGTLTFTGANTYIGGTTVTGGTLEVGNGGTIGSIAGNVTTSAGATIAFNRSDSVTYGGVIDGAGALDKRGIGQLTLTGANTYTGGTRISNGNLVVGDGGTLGSIVGDVGVASSGTLVFDRSDDVNFSGVISGDGSLTKRNTNTLILTGDSTFTGGIKLAQGTLQIANGVTSGSIASDVRMSGGTTLVFAHQNSSATPYDAYDYGGNISGAGQLVVAENAGVSLTGDATHTGGTLVRAFGELAIGNGGTTGSISGDVTLQGGAFGFVRSDDLTYAGKITGGTDSRVVQAGAGTTSLTGDNSGFSGVFYIDKGTLEINSGTGGSALVMGGTLAGTGSVTMAQVGAGSFVAPGSKADSTGTLTVNGPMQFAGGSTLSINALPDGSNSKLVVNGATSVQDGAKFQMVGLGNGLYAESTTYNVLQSTGGVTGTFTTVASSLAFLEPSLSYGANSVDLTVKLKQVPVDPGQDGSGGGDTGDSGDNSGTGGGTRPIRFADLALNRNQRSVANALQSLSPSSALYERVLNLPNGAPAAVFQSLSGETHASTSNILNGITSNVVSLPMSHLRANMDAGMTPGRPTAQVGRGDTSSLPQSAAQPVWAQVFGNWRTLGGRDESAEVRQSDGGLFIGGDQAVGGGWRAGGALGYTGSHGSIKGQGSQTDVDSYSGVIYGGKGFAAGPGKINLTLGMSYTWHDIDTKRSVNAAGASQELKSSYSANTTQFFTELGYALPVTGRITLEPFVGADYSDQRTRGFGESGGDAALMGQSTHNQVGSSTLGLRAQTTFESGSSEGRLYSSAGWRHSYGDLDPTTTMAFDGSQAFTVAGAPIARDAAVLSLGADLSITRNTTVGINYGGQFGGGNRQNSGAVNVRWRF